MRITNAMIVNNSLWSINNNEEALNVYDTQLSSGKKIQAPSDDPVVAIRALKFRTNVNEIKQFQTNAEDAKSWLTVTEQAISNSVDILQKTKKLCVQATTDILKAGDRETIITELQELKNQILNEGNVDYAGRYVFSGFKTDTPLNFIEASSDVYEIREDLTPSDIETNQVVINNGTVDEIRDIHRIRLGYSDISAATIPSTVAGFTVNAVTSATAGAYEPAVDTINFVQDTGELIFHSDNVDGTSTAIPDFTFAYDKTDFEKGDLIPENYFNCTNETAGVTYNKPEDEVNYRISGNQEVAVNTLGREFVTNSLIRDFEELFDQVNNILEDGSLKQALQEDILGDTLGRMITDVDNALDTFGFRQAEIGSKVNRIDLTINRLDRDEINFTDLLSKNEDVDYTEAVLKFKSQKTIYDASLMASSKVMQQSLLDFIR